MGFSLAGLFAFSSLLRVGELVAEDPRAETFVWEAVDAHPGCFDEITFHTQLNHSVRPLDYHRAVAAKIAPLMGRAAARGLVPGVNVLTTLGFFREEPDAAMTNLPQSVAANGHVRVGRLCPSAPETLAYVRELYATYARIRPKFIYIDDDVSMCACFCARCRAEFARRFPAARHGDVPSGPEWIEFCNARTDAVFGAAEAGAHGVDPSVELGVMFCSSGDNGLDAARWARTLRAHGKGGTVRWRPGGGCWTDHSFDELVDKAYCMAAQVRYLPSDVTAVQAEIENFPYQSLRKSPSFTIFEALFDEAVCCTGVAWDFAGFSSRDSEEFKPFFDAVRRATPTLREVADAFGRTPCSGVSFPWDGHSGTVPRANGLVQVGIPVATDPTLASVTLLDAAAVGRLSDAALTNVLRGGVFMDAGALDVLNAKGFGDLTGFRTDGPAVRDAITCDVAHPLNLVGEHVRDLRVAFGHHKVLLKLAKTADAAETTEVLTDLSGRPCGGLAGGVFENRLGGRVAVETMLPFSFADGRARTVHLKKLMRWLSRDDLPAHLASFHKAAVFVRGEKVFVANLSTEPMKGGELAIRGGGTRRISVYDAGVKTLETELKPIRADGACSVYRLPEIPHLGMALVGAGRK